MSKLMIYRDLSGLKVTPEENYHALYRNERVVTDCSAFDSPKEIVDYYCKWFGSTPGDFIVNANCYPQDADDLMQKEAV